MSITFLRPKTVDEAVQFLSEYREQAIIVNGGTDVVPDLSEKRIHPKTFIYIADIPNLKQIRQRDGMIVLGGAVTYEQMENDPITREIDGLTTCLHRLGSPVIRALATPAGNIGKAAPAADCSTMLMALRAVVTLKSVSGERKIPIEEMFTGAFQNVIRPDELITEICFPEIQSFQGTGYVKISRRKMQDIGKILVGTVVGVQEGICTDCSVSLGALNAVVTRSRDIEKRVIGKTKEEAHNAVMKVLPLEAGFRESYFKQYKEQVTGSAVDESLMQAWKNAEEVRK